MGGTSERDSGTSQMVQWLRLRTSTADGTGSNPGWGSNIPQAGQHSPKTLIQVMQGRKEEREKRERRKGKKKERKESDAKELTEGCFRNLSADSGLGFFDKARSLTAETEQD